MGAGRGGTVMRYFSIIHTHAYGFDRRVIACEGDFIEAYNKAKDPEEFMSTHTGLDVEFDKGEEIEIDEICMDKLPIVTL